MNKIKNINIELDGNKIEIDFDKYSNLKEYLYSLNFDYLNNIVIALDWILPAGSFMPFYIDNNQIVFNKKIEELNFSEYEIYGIRKIDLSKYGGIGDAKSDYLLMAYRALNVFWKENPLTIAFFGFFVRKAFKFLDNKELIHCIKSLFLVLNQKKLKLKYSLFKKENNKKPDAIGLNIGFKIIQDMYSKGYLDNLEKYEDKIDERNKDGLG